VLRRRKQSPEKAIVAMNKPASVPAVLWRDNVCRDNIWRYKV
jgi:hypothetical protein